MYSFHRFYLFPHYHDATIVLCDDFINKLGLHQTKTEEFVHYMCSCLYDFHWATFSLKSSKLVYKQIHQLPIRIVLFSKGMQVALRCETVWWSMSV